MSSLKEAWARVQERASETLVMPSNLATKIENRDEARGIAEDVMKDLYGLDPDDIDDFIVDGVKALLGMLNGGAALDDTLASVLATTLMIGIEYGIEYGKEADPGGAA